MSLTFFLIAAIGYAVASGLFQWSLHQSEPRWKAARTLLILTLVFHTAGLVASRPESEVWRVNAIAPRLAVEAAARAGVRRLVLTSSVGALGPWRSWRRRWQPRLSAPNGVRTWRPR